MEQTAMEILIEKMKEELLHLDNNSAESILLTATIRLADTLLIDERRQIKQAFDAGEFNMLNSKRDECFEFKDANDYFNKTFKETEEINN